MSADINTLIEQMKKARVPIDELKVKTADEIDEILTAVTEGEKSIGVPTATLAVSFGEVVKDKTAEEIKKSLKKYDRRTTKFHIIPGNDFTKVFVLTKKEQTEKAKKADERKVKLAELRATKKAEKEAAEKSG